MSEFKYKIAPKTFNSEVSIIIPFHGHHNHVVALVESVLRGTYTNRYNIILVDDASGKEFLKDEKDKDIYVPYTKLIRLEKHSGFGAALKAGFAVSTSPYVCFLNSDCLIQHPAWLENMGETLLKMKKNNVRLVSARSNNPVSDVPGLKCERWEPGVDCIVDEPLPLFCALCHRELFSRIGGFIKEYEFGGYEDTELFYRMKRFGYKQAISGKAWIHHEGQLTINSLCKNNPEAAKVIFETNRERCLQDLK